MNGFDAHLPPAIGMIELSSIARGIETADAMLKAAEVALIMSRTICSGKYIALVAGDVAAVEASVAAGLEIARKSAIDDPLIANVHPSIFPAITATNTAAQKGAMGIVESFSVASFIEGADAAAELISRKGLLVNRVVIPAPRDEILGELI